MGCYTSRIGTWVWSRETHGDTRALPYRVACLVPWGMWRCESSSTPGAGLEPRGHAATPESFPVGCSV
jgi:hypothetical protein